MARSRADAVFPRFNLVTPEFMKEARRRGWFVGTWTVNEPTDMKRLLSYGVDAMASNFPERAVYVYSNFCHTGESRYPGFKASFKRPFQDLDPGLRRGDDKR